MGRNIGTFLEFEEILTLMDEANSLFDEKKRYAAFLLVSGCTEKHFNVHVSMGNKKLPSVLYSVSYLPNKILVCCDHKNFEDCCQIISRIISEHMEYKNEKL